MLNTIRNIPDAIRDYLAAVIASRELAQLADMKEVYAGIPRAQEKAEAKARLLQAQAHEEVDRKHRETIADIDEHFDLLAITLHHKIGRIERRHNRIEYILGTVDVVTSK